MSESSDPIYVVDELDLRPGMLDAFLKALEVDYEPGARHRENLVAFLLHDALPKDLRHVFHRDVVSEARAPVTDMLRDDRLAELLLDGL